MKRTKELEAEARILRNDGHSYYAIARYCNVYPDTVKAWCEPEFEKMRRERIKRNRWKREGKPQW